VRATSAAATAAPCTGATAPPSRPACLAVLGRVRGKPRGCCCAERGAASVDKRAQECGQAQVLIALALSRACEERRLHARAPRYSSCRAS